MLSLRHFTIFKAVSETGSFTKAARQLYITQSAVSHAIRELEEETGTLLFDRLPKQVRLTSGGKLLLEEITPILASCDSLEKRIGHLEQRAPIHIVSSITIASFRLPRILQDFKMQMPDIPVYVKVVSAADAVEILKDGDTDLAFVEGARPQGPFHCRTFSDYTLKIVCAPDYPAPCRMNAGEFCSEKLLLRETGSAIRDTLDSTLYLAGCSARPMWVSVNSNALLEAAGAGLGITVLPEVLVKNAVTEGRLREIEVEGLTLTNDMTAVWHKDKHMSQALKTLLSCIRA